MKICTFNALKIEVLNISMNSFLIEKPSGVILKHSLARPN